MMAEPLARMETAGEGVLADAAHRLDRALQSLEAAFVQTRTSPAELVAPSAQIVELETARRRGRELESVAAEASETLGWAVAEVRRALQEDEDAGLDPQPSLFDEGLLESPLESEAGLADDPHTTADDSSPSDLTPEKEPAA